MTTALEPELSTYRWSSHDEADRFPVEDPATGEVITFVQGGGTAEVNAAVEAAHRAFQTDWRWRPPAERAALLLKAADILAEHADELALLESRENGKPVADARSNDINFLIGVFRFFGSKTQQQRVLSYIRAGIDEGATIAAQAAVPADPDLANGFWVAPTVFTDVTRTMRIAREEIFGPVVTVTRPPGLPQVWRAGLNAASQRHGATQEPPMDAVSTTNPGPAGTGHAPRLRRDALLAVASIAQFMVVLDVTIINVALPEMRTALHMSTTRCGRRWKNCRCRCTCIQARRPPITGRCSKAVPSCTARPGAGPRRPAATRCASSTAESLTATPGPR
jgi:hypothetical protein